MIAGIDSLFDLMVVFQTSNSVLTICVNSTSEMMIFPLIESIWTPFETADYQCSLLDAVLTYKELIS